MKPTALVAAFIATAAFLVNGRRRIIQTHRTHKQINVHDTITFGWCREANQSHTCGEHQMDHGRCYNLVELHPYLNDNIETVSVINGRCVIWEKDNCHGDHTGMVTGSNITTDHLCPGYPWSRRATSLKCCAGDLGAHWCADPGKVPKCTD
ncbi:hypothetical protein B0T10DRAFT_265033 [Thelonectria olida]|uniref:Uncharacterized protein n=1 Tax=Thelonectria olida TaxID=1576542 RepID=A0A9P8WB43_9HYPO|nr:hypothetical protein B0T10DRAFT_265033 [Thelonectria olida]